MPARLNTDTSTAIDKRNFFIGWLVVVWLFDRDKGGATGFLNARAQPLATNVLAKVRLKRQFSIRIIGLNLEKYNKSL
jgi:hypothetical protein